MYSNALNFHPARARITTANSSTLPSGESCSRTRNNCSRLSLSAAHGGVFADLLPIDAYLSSVVATSRLHELVGGRIVRTSADRGGQGSAVRTSASAQGDTSPLRGPSVGTRQLVGRHATHLPATSGPWCIRAPSGPDSAGSALCDRHCH